MGTQTQTKQVKRQRKKRLKYEVRNQVPKWSLVACTSERCLTEWKPQYRDPTKEKMKVFHNEKASNRDKESQQNAFVANF